MRERLGRGRCPLYGYWILRLKGWRREKLCRRQGQCGGHDNTDPTGQSSGVIDDIEACRSSRVQMEEDPNHVQAAHDDTPPPKPDMEDLSTGSRSTVVQLDRGDSGPIAQPRSA